MTSSHMKKIVWGCILLLTSVAFFSSGLWAQQQTQTAADETGYYYTVQEGDTLWDISQKFFNNPELWPDLWGQNKGVANPHLIYPGNMLHIYMRGGKVYMEKVESKPAPAVSTSGPEQQPEPPYFLYSSMAQVGFIRNPAVSPHGVIFKIQGDKKIAAAGDILYIRQAGSDSLPLGGTFTIYRTFGPIEDSTDNKATVGVQHYFTGTAKVTSREEGYVLAEVVDNYHAIEIDDQVMPYEEKSKKIYLSENPPQISGSILQSEQRAELMGDFSVAFIDKGKRDGVAEGQQFHIYNQESVKLNPGDNKTTLLPTEELGTLLVLHAESDTATVLVLTSKYEIFPGAKFATTLD